VKNTKERKRSFMTKLRKQNLAEKSHLRVKQKNNFTAYFIRR